MNTTFSIHFIFQLRLYIIDPKLMPFFGVLHLLDLDLSPNTLLSLCYMKCKNMRTSPHLLSTRFSLHLHQHNLLIVLQWIHDLQIMT
ncbi:hypothetical protein ACJX0J_027541, partial [Zea mays]